MSELFTQTNKQKKLFRTEEDIVANIQTQFGMPHTGKDLLLDAKMGPNKNQSSRLDSEPDALSDTGMSDDVGAGDTSGILHDSAGGNKKKFVMGPLFDYLSFLKHYYLVGHSN